MKLLPYDEFKVFVQLPPSEICRRLLENVSKNSFWSTGNVKFKGDVQKSTFVIYRYIRYRNAGLPILLGELEELEGGTEIKVRMRLHKFVQLFLAFLVVFLLNYVARGVESHFAGIMIILAGGVTIYLGFWFEAGKSKLMFTELFEKEIVTANEAARPE